MDEEKIIALMKRSADPAAAFELALKLAVEFLSAVPMRAACPTATSAPDSET